MKVAHGNPKLTLDELTELLILLVGVVVFFTLVGLDTCNGLKKGLHWIPGDALILSALTIQLMNWLNGESTLLKQILDSPEALNGELIKNNLFMTHCSRVMVCVLVGYLLPGMARPGYEDSWGKLTAVGLIMFLHISSELFTVHQRLGHSKGLSLVHRSFYFWPHVNELTENSFIVSSLIISLSLVWLILLLSSATIANISIRNIMSQRIPVILAQQSNGAEPNSWEAIENQVLKSWIVARGCYPEYIMARSVLASSAALAVTVCILSSVLGWIVQGPIIQIFYGPQFWLKFIISILEVIFSLVGWAIIGWRCITSVTYYRKLRTDKMETWREYFRVEDFWTRHILELQEAKELRMRKREVDEWVSKIMVTEEKSISLLTILSRLVFWVQYVVVSFSKACGFLTELILYNRLMVRLLSMLLSKHEDEVQKELLEYDAILQNVNVAGETPRSVFLANRKSIKQAKEILLKGNHNGQGCKELVEFLTAKMSPGGVGMQCSNPGTSQCETGLKFLCRRDPCGTLALETNFSYASKQSWKLTAVSLIHLIVRLSPPCGKRSLKVYLQASELMDLVDESNPETDNLLSRAADRVYQTLCDSPAIKTIKDAAGKISEVAEVLIEDAAGKISEIAEESKKDAEMIGHGGDSVDWKKAAAGNALYKLCKSIDCRSGGDFKELLDELQSALADIIGACIKQVGATLVSSSKKWAQEMQERKLLEAVYVAGKSNGLMKQLGWSANVCN